MRLPVARPAPPSVWRWLIGLLAQLGLWCAIVAAPAFAHPMPESRAWIDTTPAGVMLTLQLPLDRLEIAYKQPLAQAPAAMVGREADGLARYLLAHVGARAGGQGWTVMRPSLHVEGEAPTAELVATMALIAPRGADPRKLTLLLDVITHEIRTHRMLVFLRNDWAAGQVALAPQLLGEVRYTSNTVDIALPATHAGSSFYTLWKAGLQHIAEGSDHLLFLLLLVIAAPLAMQGRHWGGPRPVGPAIRQITLVVSAFTVGHFATLVLGSTGVLAIPARYVEIAVAVTIALAAVHAMRPWFQRGEIMMALGFGLIHGMAFSASLTGAGLTIGQHALALLAFNLGIEAMQLIVLLIALPPLLLMAHTHLRAFTSLRIGCAWGALLIAAQWIVERSGISPWGAAGWFDAVMAQGLWIGAALWLVALTLYGWRRMNRTPIADYL